MRILTHSMALEPLGGIEISTLQDSIALAERGHRLDVMYGWDGPLRPQYEDAGIGLHGPFEFSFDPRHTVKHLAGYLPSARRARRLQADVLWLNRVEFLVWGQAVSRWSGIPLVCQLHNRPAYNRMGLMGTGVAHFVAVSEFMRHAYIEKGVPPERISLLYNAIPREGYPVGGRDEQAAARKSLGLPPDVPIVLCYGQMSEEKGVAVLLEAWRGVTSRTPDALLVLIDATSAFKTVDTAVQRGLDALDPNHYRVFPVTSDVIPFLHASDVVAFPTLLPEAFGRVVIEGMATGRPVVASRVGAVPEILDGPMARFLVEPGSSAQLAERLSSVLHWRQCEPALGEACAEWVARRFPFDAHVDGLEAVLEAHGR